MYCIAGKTTCKCLSESLPMRRSGFKCGMGLPKPKYMFKISDTADM